LFFDILGTCWVVSVDFGYGTLVAVSRVTVAGCGQRKEE
jgi:hypothetical protein